MPQIKCPNGHRLQVPERAIGQTVTCPTCETSFMVESAGEPSGFDVSVGGDEKRPALSSGGIKGLPGGFTVVTLINCFVGRPLLFFGLILVILGRGCDATGMRSVGRTTAHYRQAQESFRLEWDGKLAAQRQKVDKKNREISDMNFDGKFGDPDFQKRLNELTKEQASLQKDLGRMQQDQSSATAEKDAGEWKPLREASMKAASNHQMSIYWYEWVFIFGTIVLVLGILTLAFTGQGPEKWIAYIMIAIITFSIYVVGAAWIESVFSSFGARGPGF